MGKIYVDYERNNFKNHTWGQVSECMAILLPISPLLKSLVSLYFTSFLMENLKIILGIKTHKDL